MSLGILVAMLKPRWQKAIKIIIILFLQLEQYTKLV